MVIKTVCVFVFVFFFTLRSVLLLITWAAGVGQGTQWRSVELSGVGLIDEVNRH